MRRCAPVAAVVAATAALAAVLLVLLGPTSSAQPVRPGSESRAGERAPVGDPDDDELVAEGRELYVTGCSSCHGLDGEGVGDNPSLQRSGQAAAYYYLTTGRMPLADSDTQPRRKRPAYKPRQIEALVAYVASISEGPEVPDLDLADAHLAEGGELYRQHCAPCHSAGGIGGALNYGRAAPTLHPAEPLQIASAVRYGPGQMPRFGADAIDEEQLRDIVAYVRYIADPENPGGASLGQAGPVPEGFVAWVFGVGAMVLATLWIGTRHRSQA